MCEADVNRIRQSVGELRSYLENVIEERRATPRDDFISTLLNAEIDGDILSTIQVLSTTILIHFCGSETPSHLISSALIAMFEDPETHGALLEDNFRAGSLIDETLRFWSPVNLVFQTATRDIELHDKKIPAGAFVLSYISSANRDERRFTTNGQNAVATFIVGAWCKNTIRFHLICLRNFPDLIALKLASHQRNKLR